MKAALLPALMASLAICGALPAHAENDFAVSAEVVTVDLLEGWRDADGHHIAAIHLTLGDGWKTYWRAPGDGGLPTKLSWSHSENLEDVQILWPRPTVFDADGMRSVGYVGDFVLPIDLTPIEAGDITLNARLHFGVCKEVCVPAVVDLRHVLKSSQTEHVTQIRAALSTAPIAADQAGVQSVTCAIEPTDKGHTITVDVTADVVGKSRAMVVELSDPEVWISATDLTSDGPHWSGKTDVFDHRDTAAAIDPSDVRITLLTEDAAVDIHGCDPR